MTGKGKRRPATPPAPGAGPLGDAMAFLAPLFLAGLLALAVPLLVHLTHRQRREPVPFPSLMFLRRIEFRTTRRQRIHPRRADVCIAIAAKRRREIIDDAAAFAAERFARDSSTSSE